MRAAAGATITNSVAIAAILHFTRTANSRVISAKEINTGFETGKIVNSSVEYL